MSNKYLFLPLYQKLKIKRIISNNRNLKNFKTAGTNYINMFLSQKIKTCFTTKRCQIHEFHHFGDIFKRKKF